jgi:hypothetical protein
VKVRFCASQELLHPSCRKSVHRVGPRMGCGGSTSASSAYDEECPPPPGPAPLEKGGSRSRSLRRLREPTEDEMKAAGCSTVQQRYMGTARELRSSGFKGRVRMISVALNYEGTDSPLGCRVDSERINRVAKRAGCKDIVKLYDDGSTAKFPDRAGVVEAIREVGARCGPEDYLVVSYSGHGNSVENASAATGVDCLLCLRTRDGEDETMVDDELATLITDSIGRRVRILVLVDACHSGGILDMDTPGLWTGRRVCCISGCKEGQLSVDSGNGGVMTNALLQVLGKRKVRRRRAKRDLSVQFVFNRMVAAMPEDDDEEEDDEEEGDDDHDDEEEEEDDDEDAPGYVKYWDDLSRDERTAAAALGFTKEKWDGDDDEGTAGERYWSDLSKKEKASAKVLGYDEEDWDEEEEESDEDSDEEQEGEADPGQDLTLSWPAGQDPCKITWPF